MSKKPVYYIYVQYGSVKQTEGIARLRSFHEAHFGGSSTILVIDNKLDLNSAYLSLGDDLVKMSGNNWNREFSGYDLGIGYAKNQLGAQQDDVVLIANDTFFTNYGDEYLKQFNRRKIKKCIQAQAILGHIDAFPKEVSLFGLHFQQWIRTSFFVSTFKVLSEIGPFSIPWHDNQLFSGQVEPFFSQSALLSRNYIQYVSYWLFDFEKKAEEFPFEWHSKELLSEANLLHFQGKVRSILAEHYFSARAKKLEIPLHRI